jgi:hypothetical protein
LEEEPDERIGRILVTNIQPGTFILVRTGGGGDYIIPIADRILGAEAEKSRKYQSNWKKLLGEYVNSHGLLQTSLNLIDLGYLGSKIANEVNVRNWLSPRSIRTQSYDDFFAIMKLIRLDSVANEYWVIMDLINNAHRKAGYKIRELLLEQVRDLDINQLHKLGKIEFKLSEDDDGGITAFRVVSVINNLITVPYSRIGQPFKLDNSVWQG